MVDENEISNNKTTHSLTTVMSELNRLGNPGERPRIRFEAPRSQVDKLKLATAATLLAAAGFIGLSRPNEANANQSQEGGTNQSGLVSEGYSPLVYNLISNILTERFKENADLDNKNSKEYSAFDKTLFDTNTKSFGDLSSAVNTNQNATLSTAEQAQTLKQVETIPSDVKETFPGSGAYIVEHDASYDAAVDAKLSDMRAKGIDVERLLGVRGPDILFKLKNGMVKRVATFERAWTHELNGNISFASLNLTALKDGNVPLDASKDGEYEFSESQLYNIFTTPTSGDGKLTLDQNGNVISDTRAPHALTNAGMNGAGIMTTDPQEAADAIAKYQNKLVTEDHSTNTVQASEAPANLQQEMLSVESQNYTTQIGFPIPKNAYEYMMGLCNNNFDTFVQTFGLVTSVYRITETKINNQIVKIGEFDTERARVTFNPNNDKANQWQIGIQQAKIADAVKNTHTADVPNTGGEVQPSPVPEASPTATPGPEVFKNDGYGVWYEVSNIDPELVSKWNFPGVFIDAPLAQNQKAVSNPRAPYNGQNYSTQDLMWGGFVESVTKQAPIQPDGTVLNNDATMINYLKQNGQLTYGVLGYDIGTKKYIVSDVTWKVEDGLQAYLRNETAPGGIRFNYTSDTFYESIGSGVYLAYYPRGTSARWLSKDIYKENAIIALIPNLRSDPNYDIRAAVVDSLYQDKPKPIDYLRYWQYNGPNDFTSDFFSSTSR